MSEAYAIEVEITAPVFETELSDRVATAITALFPNAEPTERHGEIHATVHRLDHFSKRLHQQAILDTARGVFFDSRQGETFSFRLKKQAAYEGTVNFVVDDPGELGAIAVRVRVDSPDVDTVIDAIAPPTEDGTPIDP